jgi:hypothetical protein
MICSQSALSSSVGAEGRQGMDYWKSWVKFQHSYILSSWLLNPYTTRPDLGPPPIYIFCTRDEAARARCSSFISIQLLKVTKPSTLKKKKQSRRAQVS